MTDYVSRTIVYTKGRGTDNLVVAHYWVISSQGKGLCIASIVGLNEDSAPNKIPATIGASIDEAFDKAVAKLDKLHPEPVWEKEIAARRT